MPGQRYEEDRNVYWHGSPSQEHVGAKNGLHIGTQEAARQALNARIGTPVDGDWDGSRKYGETLLAGQKTLRARGLSCSGYSCDCPEDDHYPVEGRAKFSNRDPVPHHAEPSIYPVRIVGPMSNWITNPHEDYKANGYMQAQLKTGRAKRGFYYRNVGEDSGSISAVVPNGDHIERIDRNDPRITMAEPVGFDNLLKWHEGSHPSTKNEDGTPKTFYHGSLKSFDKFKRPFGSAGIFVTPDPKFANHIHGGMYGESVSDGGQLYPVHVHSKNPFDYENPEHVAHIEPFMRDHWENGGDRGDLFGPNLAVSMLKDGDFSLIERPTIQNWISTHGYDGFYVNEGSKNLGVYKPEQIKSAIGNQGTYASNNPRIDMSEASRADSLLKDPEEVKSAFKELGSYPRLHTDKPSWIDHDGRMWERPDNLDVHGFMLMPLLKRKGFKGDDGAVEYALMRNGWMRHAGYGNVEMGARPTPQQNSLLNHIHSIHGNECVFEFNDGQGNYRELSHGPLLKSNRIDMSEYEPIDLEQKMADHVRSAGKEVDHDSLWIAPSGKSYPLTRTSAEGYPHGTPTHNETAIAATGLDKEALKDRGWVRYRGGWSGNQSSNVDFHEPLTLAQFNAVRKLHGNSEGRFFWSKGQLEDGRDLSSLRQHIRLSESSPVTWNYADAYARVVDRIVKASECSVAYKSQVLLAEPSADDAQPNKDSNRVRAYLESLSGDDAGEITLSSGAPMEALLWAYGSTLRPGSSGCVSGRTVKRDMSGRPMVLKNLPTDDIKTTEPITPEEIRDPAQVERVRAQLRAGERVEPVVATSGLDLTDGHHRFAAYKTEGRDTIPVWVQMDGPSGKRIKFSEDSSFDWFDPSNHLLIKSAFNGIRTGRPEVRANELAREKISGHPVVFAHSVEKNPWDSSAEIHAIHAIAPHGSGEVMFSSKDGYFPNMYLSKLSPKLRRKGIGRRMYEHAIGLAHSQGHQYLKSDGTVSPDARAVYERLKQNGYEVEPSYKNESDPEYVARTPYLVKTKPAPPYVDPDREVELSDEPLTDHVFDGDIFHGVPPHHGSWLTGDDARPLKLYHGTTKDFDQFGSPNALKGGTSANASGPIDRRIGSHVARDPAVSNSFTRQGVVSGDTLPGSRVLPVRLWLRGVHHVESGHSDQDAIWKDALHRLLDSDTPDARDLFARMSVAANDSMGGGYKDKGRDYQVYSNAHTAHANGLPFNYPEGHRDGSAQDYFMKDGNPLSPSRFIANKVTSGMFGLPQELQDEIVNKYREGLQKDGYDAIRYENTAPMEVRHVPEAEHRQINPDSYIVFDPRRIKGYFGKSQPDFEDPRLLFSEPKPGTRSWNGSDDSFVLVSLGEWNPEGPYDPEEFPGGPYPLTHYGFYSRLRDLIDRQGRRIAPSELKGLISNSAISQDEYNWSGIKDLIDKAEADRTNEPVSKEDLLNTIDENLPILSAKVRSQQNDQKAKDVQNLFFNSYALADRISSHENPHTDPSMESLWRDKLKGAIVNRMTNGVHDDNKYDLENLGLSPESQRYIEQTVDKFRSFPKSELIAQGLDPDYETKFDKGFEGFQMPGGSNYEEHLLGLGNRPGRTVDGPQTHWKDDPSTLIHLRTKDYPDDTFHVDEIQSDWHQKGHKEGYGDQSKRKEFEERVAHNRGMAEAYRAKINDAMHLWLRANQDRITAKTGPIPGEVIPHIDGERLDHYGRLVDRKAIFNHDQANSALRSWINRIVGDPSAEDTEADRIAMRAYRPGDSQTIPPFFRLFGNESVFYNKFLEENPDAKKMHDTRQWHMAQHDLAQGDLDRLGDQVPNAPYSKNWNEIALRYALRQAAQRGAKRMTWTTGATQRDRNDISRYVKSLEFMPWSEPKPGSIGFLHFQTNYGGPAHSEEIRDHSHLEEHVGKDVAEKLMHPDATRKNRLGEGTHQYPRSHSVQKAPSS